MMKIAKLTSLILSVAVLSACGGGGKGTAQTPDGDKINLEISDKGTIGGKTKDGALFGQNSNYSFYGVWQNDAKTLRELRYQGETATNIPRSGVATYKGDAVWISGYDTSFRQGGVTTLNVDFGAKTVDGSIKFSPLNGDELRRNITLHKGTLSGAEFSGKASVLGNSSGHYQGGLFGPNAKEAAGLVQFKTNSDLDVSFGGQKQ
ncbi:Slam-dependent surface lipoprotein [Frederiksenia canicola]